MKHFDQMNFCTSYYLYLNKNILVDISIQIFVYCFISVSISIFLILEESFYESKELFISLKMINEKQLFEYMFMHQCY